MIETLTRPATNSALVAATETRSVRTVDVSGSNLSVAATRLAAAGALGVSLISRIGASVAGASSTPLLVALLVLSMLAFFVAAIDPPIGKVDERVATMCRRASIVQSVVGVAALVVAFT